MHCVHGVLVVPLALGLWEEVIAHSLAHISLPQCLNGTTVIFSSRWLAKEGPFLFQTPKSVNCFAISTRHIWTCIRTLYKQDLIKQPFKLHTHFRTLFSFSKLADNRGWPRRRFVGYRTALTSSSLGLHCMSSTDWVWAEYGRWLTTHEPSSLSFQTWMDCLQSPVASRPFIVLLQSRAYPSDWCPEKVNNGFSLWPLSIFADAAVGVSNSNACLVMSQMWTLPASDQVAAIVCLSREVTWI